MSSPAKPPKGKALYARVKRRTGRGALWIIAFIFILSAGARLGSGTGAAIAREVSELSSGSEVDVTPDEPLACDLTEAASVLKALQSREAALREKESSVAVKLKAIELARVEIADNMVALEKAEKRLAATMATARTAAEDDLEKLTTVYESMKPKEAAQLFEQMAPDFAAGFIARMNPEAAAAVLTGLKPETAYSLSVILAGRNANAPNE